MKVTGKILQELMLNQDNFRKILQNTKISTIKLGNNITKISENFFKAKTNLSHNLNNFKNIDDDLSSLTTTVNLLNLH